MVASTAAELSICIIPSRLRANKPPINKTDIIRRDTSNPSRTILVDLNTYKKYVQRRSTELNKE